MNTLKKILGIIFFLITIIVSVGGGSFLVVMSSLSKNNLLENVLLFIFWIIITVVMSWITLKIFHYPTFQEKNNKMVSNETISNSHKRARVMFYVVIVPFIILYVLF